MKKITILAAISLFLFTSCDDSVSDKGTLESREEKIQHFLEHAIEGHFDNSAKQDTVAIADTPELHSDGDVYTIAFDGATSGTAHFHYGEDDPHIHGSRSEHDDHANHDRTFMTDAAVTLTITDEATGTVMTPEEELDLSGTTYTAAPLKKVVAYHLEPKTEYEISFAGVAVDTLRLFIAPRGLIVE